MAACDLVGGEAGVLLTVAKARCELGYHLGSVVVTTLWWGRYNRGLRTWTCTSDLAIIIKLTSLNQLRQTAHLLYWSRLVLFPSFLSDFQDIRIQKESTSKT